MPTKTDTTNYALNIDQQSTIRLALADRIEWLKSLGLENSGLMSETRACLALFTKV